MKYRTVPSGVEDFKRIIDEQYYYVDKTLLIKEIIDNNSMVNLFTRPRRFGKTLNMSMIQYFFENSNEDNSYLFDGLNIMNEDKKYSLYMGQYPVINLSLKSAKQPTFDLAYKCIIQQISNEFSRHKYILKSEIMKNDKERFEKIINMKDDQSLYITSLMFLSECLQKYHNKKVIILIDEYDVPLENSFFRGFYEQMIDFIRSLFESALKTNNALEFGIITGCLRISKESIFTGLNNLNIMSILNHKYSEFFGFTEHEVEQILRYYTLEDKMELVKYWYNGYIFGKTIVYNPWSVVKYIFDANTDREVLPSSYWANTSSNSIVKSLIEKADLTTKQEIEKLIAGDTIEKPIYEDITYDEVYKNMNNLWNFMYFTGYLKKVGERMDETSQRYLTLKIPNEEIRYIFRYKVLDWFEEQIKAKDLSKIYTSIINGDAKTFEDELGRLLRETISFIDAYENFYHGFVLGVLANMHDYIIKSNREGGSGRSDVFIKSASLRGIAIVIEFKVSKNLDELEEKAKEAIKQIEDKKYDMELKEEGYRNIIKYGIAFYRKECAIEISK